MRKQPPKWLKALASLFGCDLHRKRRKKMELFEWVEQKEPPPQPTAPDEEEKVRIWD